MPSRGALSQVSQVGNRWRALALRNKSIQALLSRGGIGDVLLTQHAGQCGDLWVARGIAKYHTCKEVGGQMVARCFEAAREPTR